MNKNRVKYLIVPQIVSVRKYEVEIEKLQKLLKEHKNLTNKQIAEQLSCSVTKVEHWFRTDSYFCIPDAEYWHELKKLLNISSDYFDVSILEFEEREGVFDKAERVYLTGFCCPTLTTLCKNEKFLVRMA